MGKDIKFRPDEEHAEIERLYEGWEPEWQASANTTSSPVQQAFIGMALLALRTFIPMARPEGRP